MGFIGRYFWFICLAVWLLNTASWRSRVQKLVALQRLTEDEADTFMRAVTWGLAAPMVALGMISLKAHLSWPLCAKIVSFGDWASTTSSIIVIAVWSALLLWVWVGDGARILSRVGPVLWNRPNFERVYSPKLVRLALTALVLVSAFGSSAARKVQRDTGAPDVMCQSPAAAG